MELDKNKTNYFFVDEAGDAVFFDKYGKNIVGQEGCSNILILGFVMVKNPDKLRKSILGLKTEIISDKYLEKIPSIVKSKRAFHAKDDCPEVREKFYKLIKTLDFSAEFYVARKIEQLFRKRHKSNQNVFYDDLIIKLFQNKLHLASINHIYFAVRGNKSRQMPLENAIQTSILTFENKWDKKVDSTNYIFPQSPSGEPCLQIIDYMNWAIYRAFTNHEERYLRFIEEKIKFLVDIYDFDKYPKNFYNSKNKFDINKISPL